MNATNARPGRELTFTRTLRAPRDLVWQVWTDPKHLAEWWGPAGFTNPRCEVDVRPGGALHIDMRAPDGTIYPAIGEYSEVDPPKRLVFISGAADTGGNPIFKVRNTLTLMERDGKTYLTMHALVIEETAAAAPYLAGQEEGWNQTLDKLAAYLSKM